MEYGAKVKFSGTTALNKEIYGPGSTQNNIDIASGHVTYRGTPIHNPTVGYYPGD